MDKEISRAEQLYLEGLELFASEQIQQQKDCIQLFQESLKLGLDAKTDIECRGTLGVALFDLYREQFSDLSELGLSSSKMKGLNEAVTTLEDALKLDTERGTKVFFERVPQCITILRLNAVWQSQSFYVKNQFGLEKKLHYLQEKLKLLEYLDGVKPPSLCLSIAFYYKDVGDRPHTLEWLKNAAEADIYTDVDGESLFYQMAERTKQSGKKGVKEMSTPSSTSSKSPQKESSGGCFIATATYGSPLAPEVITFRQFRDETLLPSKLGSAFVRFYYFVSPVVANVIANHKFLQAITRRIFLEPILRLIKK